MGGGKREEADHATAAKLTAVATAKAVGESHSAGGEAGARAHLMQLPPQLVLNANGENAGNVSGENVSGPDTRTAMASDAGEVTPPSGGAASIKIRQGATQRAGAGRGLTCHTCGCVRTANKLAEVAACSLCGRGYHTYDCGKRVAKLRRDVVQTPEGSAERTRAALIQPSVWSMALNTAPRTASFVCRLCLL